MLHGLIRREPGGEPCSTNADDDAIGGRRKGKRIVERLIHGWEDIGGVQHDVNKGRYTEESKHPATTAQTDFLFISDAN